MPAVDARRGPSYSFGRHPDGFLPTADLDRIVQTHTTGVTHAVALMLENVIRSLRFSAGAEVVAALHGRVGKDPERLAPLVWHAMHVGLKGPRARNYRRVGPTNSFVEFCWYSRRMHVLRAVLEAGVPDWFANYPGQSSKQLRLGQPGVIDVPQGLETSADWLRVLAITQSMPERVFGLLRVLDLDTAAGASLSAQQVEGVKLAVEHDPSLTGLEHCLPGFRAQVLQLLMEHRISAATANAPVLSASSAPRARRQGL